MTSQQSNPATLREALRWYAGEIDSFPCEDVEHADDGNAWNSNKDVPSIPNIIFDQGKRAKAALAASGTEAAPTPAEIALEHDRTKVAECVTAVKHALHNYSWLIEGRGSYEWDDDRWHGEFRSACDNFAEAIGPMVRIAADWSNCPKKWEDVQAARSAQAAASPEAAPSENFDSDQTARVIQGHLSLSQSDTALVKGYLHRAFVAGTQAAASPEGEGREAQCDVDGCSNDAKHELLLADYCMSVCDAHKAEADSRTGAFALRQSAAPSGGAVAAQHVDWTQVLLVLMNGHETKRDGQPCFYIDPEGIEPRFCLRAKFWPGHDEMHKFVSLADLFAQESKTGAVKGAGKGGPSRPSDPVVKNVGNASIPESGETGAAPPRNRRKQNIPYRCGHDDCPCTGGRLHVSNRELDQKAGETGAVTETK